MVIFIAELDDLEVWHTDVTSAYLSSQNKEKVCIIAYPAFQDKEGLLLLIHIVLYGLRSRRKKYSDFG